MTPVSLDPVRKVVAAQPTECKVRRGRWGPKLSIGCRNHYAIDPRRALNGDAGRLPVCFNTHEGIELGLKFPGQVAAVGVADADTIIGAAAESHAITS
jgi:hypothetical protein